MAIHASAVLDFAPRGAEMVVRIVKPDRRAKARMVKTRKGLRGVAPGPFDEAAIENALARFP